MSIVIGTKNGTRLTGGNIDIDYIINAMKDPNGVIWSKGEEVFCVRSSEIEYVKELPSPTCNKDSVAPKDNTKMRVLKNFKSLKKGQIVLKCEFCEDDIDFLVKKKVISKKHLTKA